MPLDAPVSITSEIQKLDADSLIELYELDTTKQGGPIYYFHSDVNTLNAEVVWQGITYVPFPLEATGFESSGVGSQARPKLLLANISGMIGELTLSMNDLVTCKFIRKRTFVKYLDAVNFPDGINPTADSNAHFPDDIYYVDRKSKEDKIQVEFELASALELTGVVLPRRQIVKNLCSWNYKSAECGYTGTNYFNEFDEPCGVSLDKCGKRLGSCEIRFVNEILPFGGFPAVGLIR
jgi:lambda family phage minor tail protein L